MSFVGEHKKAIIITGAAITSAYLVWRLYKFIFVTFDDLVKVVLKNEGGYVNDPRDPGGETNMGISKRSFPNEDIENMTVPRATSIYKNEFWNKLGIGGINDDSLKLQILDHSVNRGVNTPAPAVKLLQTLVKAPITGKIDTNTITRTNAYLKVGTDLTKYYKELRKNDYKGLSNYPTYGKAWLNRVDNTNLSFF